VIVSFGTITRPPYKLIWKTDNIPNQLFTGIGILAEATIANSEVRIARQEGIFFKHKPIDRKVIPAPYAPQRRNNFCVSTADPAMDSVVQKFHIGDGQRAGSAIVAWNENGLIFHVTVNDNTFDSNASGKNLADAGIEILIDPARRRAPHPADSVLFFVVPLAGNPKPAPYRISYTAEISGDGAFKLVPQTSRVNYEYPVGLYEFKGYNVEVTIPNDVFGKSVPDTVGANIVLRLLDSAGNVHKVSLADGSMYSPFCWSDYHRLPKPVYMNAGLQWSAFFVAGFLMAFLAYVIVLRMRKPQLLSSFERSEEDKVAFNRINGVIEQELIKKDLSLDYVAKKCSYEPQALNALIKRNTGFTFANYLQYCRTEVAKERLRSSRSSEKSIADLCGFTSAMDMEKCFAKFHHTTPYKFRIQQQVA
jgi:AraC-like DNA-binding protein